jgi:predicted small lipoprotein YifL
MPKRLLPALLAALALAVALASCGGGGTTTITVMRHSRPRSGPTYLPDVATTRHFVEPASYDFSVDGDLAAKSLDWHGWGEAKATAFGKIVERPASGLVDTFSGSVTASAPHACHGARYYTEVFAHVPPQADFVPTEPTKLSTPCG